MDYTRTKETLNDHNSCPICGCGIVGFIEDSTEIYECDGCGTEWESSTGDITLDPREL